MKSSWNPFMNYLLAGTTLEERFRRLGTIAMFGIVAALLLGLLLGYLIWRA